MPWPPRVGLTSIVLGLAAGLCCGAVRPAQADPIDILFVGNSFTHGRYDPALNYNAGPADSTGTSVVHDLLCPTAGCAGSVEGVAPVNPGQNPPSVGGGLQGQLNYLNSNPSAQYTEVGPFAGVAGIFLQLTKEAGLSYDVSLIAVSSATLTGYLHNTGSEAGDLPLIESSKWNQVVLQDQSFQPLPATVNVNGVSVPTRGNPASFQSGANGLINGIDAADQSAGVPKAKITLAETPPLAAYGYTSNNPAQPIYGSSTVASQGGNPAYAPYVGDSNPNAAMALDLHNAYFGEAAAYNAAHPNGSHVQVSNSGDAWVTAMNFGIAESDPYLVNEPAGEVDLWDSDPLNACCTTPVGYHPSAIGDYLDALVDFDTITGVDPRTLSAEFDPSNIDSAAYAMGVSPTLAYELANVAALTVSGGYALPEPGSLLILATGVVALAGLRRRRVLTTAKTLIAQTR